MQPHEHEDMEVRCEGVRCNDDMQLLLPHHLDNLERLEINLQLRLQLSNVLVKLEQLEQA